MTSLKDCSAPWDWMITDAAGIARCCCHSRNDIGNIAEQGIEEIWNGAMMQQLRAALQQDRFTPYCKGAACQYSVNKQAKIDGQGGDMPPTGIEFGLHGNALDFTPGSCGWDMSEEGYSWSIAERAAVKIAALPPGSQPLWLTFRCHALVTGAHDRIEVDVTIDGRTLDTIGMADPDPVTHRLWLPPDWVRDFAVSPVKIEFHIREPATPMSLGIGDDERLLGIAMYWIRFDSEAPSPRSGFIRRLFARQDR